MIQFGEYIFHLGGSTTRSFLVPAPSVELLVSPTQELPKDVGCECSGSVDLDGGVWNTREAEAIGHMLMPRWHPKAAMASAIDSFYKGGLIIDVWLSGI